VKDLLGWTILDPEEAAGMSERAARKMTADEFLAWNEGQERRHELVDGVPVAMAGARRRHDQVVVNVLAALAAHLGVGRCRTFSSDTAVRISEYQVRYPDVGVDCGTFHDEKLEADAPRLVVEVLSDTARAFDMLVKLEEYKTAPSLRDIVLVDTDEPKLIHWTRAEGGSWRQDSVEGPEGTLEIPDLGVVLPFGVLFAGLTFQPKPRLVADGPPIRFPGMAR
jgi:Uma2 family endonuclease